MCICTVQYLFMVEIISSICSIPAFRRHFVGEGYKNVFDIFGYRCICVGMNKKTIQISAKCSDLFSAILIEDGKERGSYDGYVPKFMPGQHFGDYVELNIDIETGQILNWKKPSEAALKETFNL